MASAVEKRMPKAKNKSVRDEGSEDEYEVGTQSMTQAEKVVRSMSDDELKRKVNQMVQFILVADQKKVPIKRQDITKHVLKDQSRAFPKILEKSREILKNVFGFELHEVPNSKVSRFILVNSIEFNGGRDHVECYFRNEHCDGDARKYCYCNQRSQQDTQKMGLLTVVLTAIFMKGNIIADTELYSMLKNLGIDVERVHEDFDDVRKLLTVEFPRQLYLDYERVPKSEPPAFTFRWGPRAEKEVSKRCILDLASKVYNVDQSSWTAQYRQVCEEEGAQGQEGADAEEGAEADEENNAPAPQTSRGAGAKRRENAR